MTPPRASRTLYFAAIAITVVGLAVMLGVYPFAFDDFVYMRTLGITADGLPSTIDLATVKAHLGYRFHFDNWRLANMVACLVLALPKWLSGLMSAILFGRAIQLMGRSAGLRDTSWRPMALLCALLVFMLPWFDSIAATDYQLNYVWGTLLWAAALWIFLRPTPPTILTGGAIGITLGLWHEGLSGPMLAGLGLLWLMRRQYRTKGRTAMLAALLAGITLLAAVPGTRARMGQQTSPFESYNLIRTAIILLPVWLFALTAGMSALRSRRIGSTIPSAPLIALAGICAGGIAVKLVGDDFRAAWAASLAGCCGITLVAYTWPPSDRRPGAATSIAALLLLAVTTAHLALADTLAFRARDEYHAVVAHQKSDNWDAPLYLDILSPLHTPGFAIGKPLWSMWRWAPYETYHNLSADRLQATTIIPPALRAFTPAMPHRPLAGGIMQYEGHLLRPATVTATGATATAPRIEEYMLTTPLLAEPVPVLIYPFRSEADGHTYEYLFPAIVPPYLRPITTLTPTHREIH